VTCYMRHMDWLFDALGISSDKSSRRAVDGALREILAMPDDAHCPEIWAAIKAMSPLDRDELVPEVADRLG